MLSTEKEFERSIGVVLKRDDLLGPTKTDAGYGLDAFDLRFT